MPDPETAPVVTITPTIMDGTVVYWRRDVRAAACISASRNRVSVNTDDYQTLPPAWIQAAMGAYRQLAANRDTDLTHLATHRYDGLTLVPIATAALEQDPDA